MDSDALRQCPYDKSHQVRSSRFDYHILKCKKNNEMKLRAKEKVIVDACPFNNKHQIERHDYRHHITICPDRFRLQQEKDLNDLVKPTSSSIMDDSQNGKSSLFNDEEDWEAEAQMSAPTKEVERINAAFSYGRLTKKERKDLQKQMIEDFYQKKNQEPTKKTVSNEVDDRGPWY